MDGKRSQWASVAKLSQVIKVKDEEMLSSALECPLFLSATACPSAEDRKEVTPRSLSLVGQQYAMDRLTSHHKPTFLCREADGASPFALAAMTQLRR
jgi:hypothetical protein